MFKMAKPIPSPYFADIDTCPRLIELPNTRSAIITFPMSAHPSVARAHGLLSFHHHILHSMVHILD